MIKDLLASLVIMGTAIVPLAWCYQHNFTHSILCGALAVVILTIGLIAYCYFAIRSLYN